MTIRLIACDLDGTLMGADLCFSPRLLNAVRVAQERGITVTIATGRGFSSTVHFAQGLGVTTPLICYQGAQIRTLDGKTLYEATLSRKHLPEVNDFCRQNGWELTLYCNDQIYQATQQYDQDYYDRWFGLPLRLVEDPLSSLPNDPVKFIAIAPNRELGDILERQVRALARGQFHVMRSHDWFVEGLALGVSKGNSVARLAQSLGIARQEVMALGDSGNDISMVEWAGLGVAIGNAIPEVKAVAGVIAPPQDQDGAAWAIERYALGALE